MDILHILITAVNAVVPIVLLMAFGYVLRSTGYFTDEFLNIGNKLMFQFLLPASLFQTAYKIESIFAIPWDIVIYSVLGLIGAFLLGLLITPFVTQVQIRRGVVLQSIFRCNSAVIGIPLATVLGGDSAIAVTAVIVAFCLPVMNILAVLALSIYMSADGKKADMREVIRNIVTNPLILGVAAGMLCLAVRTAQVKHFGRVVFSFQRDLKFLYSTIEKMGSIASPFALIVLGGQFRFSAAGEMKREIAAGVICRCVLIPLLVLGGAFLLDAAGVLHCGAAEYPGLIAQFATPVAVSSAIMASQMGNDGQLATQLVVWSSVASIASMFVTVCILMAAGLVVV